MTRFAILLAASSALIPLAALAQNTSVPPVTLPGVERFQLPPSGVQPTPAPLPTIAVPTATPTQTPTPRATATRAAARPAPAATPTPRASATPTPSPSATPTAIAPVEPVATPTPIASESATPVAAEPASSTPALPWLLGGGVAIVAALGAGWALGRRGRATNEWADDGITTAVAADPVELVPTPPVKVTPPPTPTPAPVTEPTPAPAAAPIPASQTLVSELRPLVIAVDDAAATVEFEVVVTNRGTQTADALRVVVGITSAGPDLEAQIAGINANAAMASAEVPVTLAPGETYTMNNRIALPRDIMHIASAAGRPMIVPVAVVSTRWRAGLGIRSQGEAFMLGTGDGAGKLGPIWLDRGNQAFRPITARRFDPELLGRSA